MNEETGLFAYIRRRRTVAAWIIMGITAVVGLLLFSLRVDEGGDDSTYICKAMDLVATGKYPDWQGPLYPIFLAVFVGIFGMNLPVLKLTSLFLILAGQYLFYRLLKDRVNVLLVLSVMLLMGVSSYYMLFASMTYSEALFIVAEYVFLALLIRFDEKDYDSKAKVFVGAIAPAAMVTIGFLIRTIGTGFVIVGALYMLSHKSYLKTGAFVATTIVCMLLWVGIRTAIWGDVDQGSGQAAQLTLVHPYQADQGKETALGYAKRFVDNTHIYFGKRLPQILGFKEMDNRTYHPIFAWLIWGVFLYGMVKAWSRNKYVFLLGLYALVMLGASFVALQMLWDQPRLIIPYVPALLIVVFYGIYHLAFYMVRSKAKYVVASIGSLCTLLAFLQTTDKINIDVLRHNLQGDELYGYTPDWYNYLSLCSFAAEKLPDTAYIACRKPNMARIYSNGKKFYGIYRVESEDPDVLLENLRDHGVTHMIVASLRKDPQNPGNGIINTLHYYAKPIIDKYPNSFVEIGSCGVFGRETDEPAYLYEIRYPEEQQPQR